MPFITIPSLATVEFTSNGTWLCPPAVDTIVAVGCGGGGGGRGGGQSGGLGGNGARVITKRLSVTPGVTYNITIGTGGAGGAGDGGSGVQFGDFGDPGTDSTIDDGSSNLITFPGASNDFISNQLPLPLPTQGGYFTDDGGTTYRGEDSDFATGGSIGDIGIGPFLEAGGGGGASLGDGGVGGDFTATGVGDPGEDGLPGSLGSGGGGGSATTGISTVGGDGGDGGDGKVIIYYIRVRNP